MSKQNIQILFQVIAVLSMFFGAIKASSALPYLIGFQEAKTGLPSEITVQISGMATLGILGVFTAAIPLIWGGFLFKFAPAIANKIYVASSSTQ
ncbi:MAG: hypothetical protein ACI9X4_000144 [Glaciecola sp.]|jgi:hypothetical protein